MTALVGATTGGSSCNKVSVGIVARIMILNELRTSIRSDSFQFFVCETLFWSRPKKTRGPNRGNEFKFEPGSSNRDRTPRGARSWRPGVFGRVLPSRSSSRSVWARRSPREPRVCKVRRSEHWRMFLFLSPHTRFRAAHFWRAQIFLARAKYSGAQKYFWCVQGARHGVLAPLIPARVCSQVAARPRGCRSPEVVASRCLRRGSPRRGHRVVASSPGGVATRCNTGGR